MKRLLLTFTLKSLFHVAICNALLVNQLCHAEDDDDTSSEFQQEVRKNIELAKSNDEAVREKAEEYLTNASYHHARVATSALFGKQKQSERASMFRLLEAIGKPAAAAIEKALLNERHSYEEWTNKGIIDRNDETAIYWRAYIYRAMLARMNIEKGEKFVRSLLNNGVEELLDNLWRAPHAQQFGFEIRFHFPTQDGVLVITTLDEATYDVWVSSFYFSISKMDEEIVLSCKSVAAPKQAMTLHFTADEVKQKPSQLNVRCKTENAKLKEDLPIANLDFELQRVIRSQ